jgi:Flp pilus assembly protein TadD
MPTGESIRHRPNKDAIAMLERARGLDPTDAPAWSALGVRYHYDSASERSMRPLSGR